MLVRLTCKGLLPNTEHTVKHATYIKAKQSKWPLNISFLHMHSFLFFTFIVQRNKQEKQTCNRKVKYFAAAGLTLKKIYIYYPPSAPPPTPPKKHTHTTKKKHTKTHQPTKINKQTRHLCILCPSGMKWNKLLNGVLFSETQARCVLHMEPRHICSMNNTVIERRKKEENNYKEIPFLPIFLVTGRKGKRKTVKLLKLQSHSIHRLRVHHRISAPSSLTTCSSIWLWMAFASLWVSVRSMCRYTMR